jgi:DNA polymerase-3 subunit delta
MQTLKNQLKNNELKNLYLFFGKEHYLKTLYKNRVKTHLLGEAEDLMNYNYLEGKHVKASDIIDLADTLPFLKDIRLIIVENSELFKSGKKDESDKMSAYLESLPDYTYIVFIEEEIDKRNKLYKTVQRQGDAVEFNTLSEKEIIQYLGITAKKNQKNLSVEVANYFIQTVGTDMQTVEIEFEKLLSYVLNDSIITKEAIDAVCSSHIENKIFEMMNAIGEKKPSKALRLYHDLLTLKEPPLRILFMLVRQFRILLQVKTLVGSGMNDFSIANKLGLRKFIVDQSIRQVRHFSEEDLKKALFDCLEYEVFIKTGKMEDQLSVEMIILKYAN